MDKKSKIKSQISRFDGLSKLVETASHKNSAREKNELYSEKISNYNNRNGLNNDSLSSQRHPVLRSFETLDINALTNGFDNEEIKEGKLVLYITEKQLTQLLNQRAIVLPNKNEILEPNKNMKQKKYSLIDETIGNRLGRKTPIKEVELVVNQENVKRVYSNETEQFSSQATYRFELNQNHQPSLTKNKDSNMNSQNNINSYDSLDSFDMSIHKASNLSSTDQTFEKNSKNDAYNKYNQKSGSFISINDKINDEYVYARVNEYVNESMGTSDFYDSEAQPLTSTDRDKNGNVKLAVLLENEKKSYRPLYTTGNEEKIETYDINTTYYDDSLNLRKLTRKDSNNLASSIEIFDSFENKTNYQIAFLDDKSQSPDVNKQSLLFDRTISPNKTMESFDMKTMLKANPNEIVEKTRPITKADYISSISIDNQVQKYDFYLKNSDSNNNSNRDLENVNEMQKVSKYHEYLNDSNTFMSKLESELQSTFYEEKQLSQLVASNIVTSEEEKNPLTKLSIDDFDETKETSSSKNDETLVLTQLDDFFTKLLDMQKNKKQNQSVNQLSNKEKKLHFVDETFDSIESFDIGKLRRDSLTENLNKNDQKVDHDNSKKNETLVDRMKSGPSVKSTESFSKKSNGKFSYTSTIDPKTIKTNSNFKKQTHDQKLLPTNTDKTSKIETSSNDTIELDQKACKELDELLSKLKQKYKVTKKVDRGNVSLSNEQIAQLIKFLSKTNDPNDTLNSNTYSKFSSLNKKPSFLEKEQELEALKKLDEFVSKALNRNNETTNKISTTKQTINSISSIDAIDDLIEKSKKILNNWDQNIRNSTAISSKKSSEINLTGSNKTKATINESNKSSLPKVTFDKSSKPPKPNCVVKKKITYAYIDEYNPTTRVYEVADFSDNKCNINTNNLAKAKDVFNSKKNFCNNKPFDQQIANSFGKPSLSQLNKYLAGVENDMKRNIKKINPSVESTLKFQNKYNPCFKGNNQDWVLIESEGYKKYIEEITQNFNKLRVTDFPTYVNNLSTKPEKLNEPIKLMRNGNKITQVYSHSNSKQRN